MSTLIGGGVGRLGRDPESRTTDYGEVASTAIAFDHGYGDRKSTTWVRVSAWGKLGELLCRLEKGNRVSVSGELFTSTWTDKEDQERTELELKATAITVIDWPERAEAEEAPTPRKAAPRKAAPRTAAPKRKSKGGENIVEAQNKAAASRSKAKAAPVFDDDLPF